MTLIERKRAGLQAPEDAAGGGGTPAPAAAGDKPAPSAGEKPAEKKPGEAELERKSVLKPGEAAPEKKEGEGEKKAEPEKKPEEKKADEPYEVKVPEGVTVDKAKLGEFSGWAKEKGLSAAQASEALSFYAKQQTASQEAWAKQGNDWYGALEKDPEFGGAQLKESEAALQKALKRFDPQGELAADLQKYGVENLPSLAKLLRRVGLAGAEDKLVETSKGGAKGPTSENERLAKEFPSLAKELLGTT